MLLYSFGGSLINTIFIMMAIYFAAHSISIFNKNIVIDQGKVFARIDYSNSHVVMVLLGQFILLFYLSKFIQQFCNYFLLIDL